MNVQHKDRPVSETAADDFGIRLSDSWLGETEAWHIDFDEGADVPWPWTVVLEWTSEKTNPHHADWVTYTWQFYGETVERALTEAIEWCDALTEWQRRTCTHVDTYELLDEGRANDAGISQRHQCFTCGEIV